MFEKNLYIGATIVIFGFFASMVAYLGGSPYLYYFSFAMITISLFYTLFAVKEDLDTTFDSKLHSIALLLLFLVVYIAQRYLVSDSSFITGDASDYYWAGVSSALKQDDIGFFLPFTSAISAIGFKIFGYQNLAFITVIVHLVAMPIYYFLFRKIGLNQIISFLLIFLLQMVPLDIWFSKTIFSEPMWQVMLLLFILFSYKIVEESQPKWTTLLPFFLLVLLLPLSRGSAVFFYGAIYAITLYSFWKFGNFKYALYLLFGILLLTIAIQYALPIRYRYLVGWQYRRIIPGVTISQLTIIFYSLVVVSFSSFLLLRSKKAWFQSLNLPLVIVMVSITLKVLAALFFSIKKGVPFINLLFLNEFGLARGNLNIVLVVFILIGLLYMHYLATKGDRLALLLVLLYALFSIPFVMQNVSIWDQHEMFMYWHRYYFSELFSIHILALAMFIRSLYSLNAYLNMPKMRFALVVATLMVGLFFSSVSLPLHNVVTSGGYLQKSSEIFSWLADRSKSKSVAVLYDKDIQYGFYDAKQLLYRGFYVTGVDVQSYTKVAKKDLKSGMNLSPNILHSEQLLCLTTTSCALDRERFELVDKFSLSLWWRRNSVNLDNKEEHLDIYAYLYDIKHIFAAEEHILFQKSSDIAPRLLGDGWYHRGLEAVWSSPNAKLTLPNIFEKDAKYQLKLLFQAYNPHAQKDKKISFFIGDKKISQLTIEERYPTLYTIDIPKEITTNVEDKNLIVEIKIENTLSPYEIGASKDRRKLGIKLYSLELHKLNK